MKSLLLNYSKYNLWANKKIADFLSALSEEQLEKEIVSSFPSLKKTVLHVWDAQQIWLIRLQGTSLTDFPSKNFSGTFEDVMGGCLKTSQELVDFVESSSENFLLTPLTYKNIAGDEFRNNVSDIIQHVMNHSTYHRGQIITMLRQLGITNLFSTDYIAFCRAAEEIKKLKT